jgi:hypothetical protein
MGLSLAGQSFMRPQHAATGPQIASYLATTPSAGLPHDFEEFVEKLSRKQLTAKTETQFLQQVFARTHRTYLKRYKEHTAFADLFADGSYNCLTGTILFSTLLNHFGIPHDVIETNYHIFIIAYTQQGDVLIEATDVQEGFVTSATKINDRISRYKANTVQTADATLAFYQYNFTLYRTVSQHELVGLLYYNLAVEAFNQWALGKATQYLVKAGERYVSPRIEEFSELLLVAVHESTLNFSEKNSLKKTLQTIRYKALPAVAALQ